MAPPLMHVWERRALSVDEIQIGRGVFGDAVAWDRVRVLQTPPLWFSAVVPLGRTIVFGRWRAVRDFSAASIQEQAWFVHELTHVWQAANGIVLAAAKLGALGKRAYAVKQRQGASLTDYNIEAQAEIARLLFLARADALEPNAPKQDWLEDIWRAAHAQR